MFDSARAPVPLRARGSDTYPKPMGFRSPYASPAGMHNVRPVDPTDHVPCVVFVGADPADVRLARNVLEEDAGADLRVVPDTRHALGLLRTHLPALIVTD